MISQLPKPLADFQPAALRAAKLAYTITSLPQATPLFRTRLLKLITDYWADVEITQFDVNGDGKLSGTEVESLSQVKRYVTDRIEMAS